MSKSKGAGDRPLALSPFTMTAMGRRSAKMLSVGTALFAVALLASGCSGGKAATLRPNPSISGELESRENALPPGFPKDMPLPGGRTVLYSATSQLGLVSYFSSSLAGAPLRDFFLGKLRNNGWRLHSCVVGRSIPEPVWILVASKGGRVASVTVGYSPEFATRLGNTRYTFFVSIAENRPAPQATASACEAVPTPAKS